MKNMLTLTKSLTKPGDVFILGGPKLVLYVGKITLKNIRVEDSGYDSNINFMDFL